MLNEWISFSKIALLIDFAGSLLVALSAGRVVFRYVLAGGSLPAADQLRLSLATDLVTALSFKTGAGIIRTLTVASWPQFLLLLAIISLRFFLGQVLKRQH